jgi:hypothetical protein
MLVVLILYILNAVHICTKSTDIMFPYTAKILQYTENSKHRKGTAQPVPIPTFMFLCAIYIFPRSVCLFGCTNMGISIDRSQTHECGNWNLGRTVAFRGIHKSKFFAVWS